MILYHNIQFIYIIVDIIITYNDNCSMKKHSDSACLGRDLCGRASWAFEVDLGGTAVQGFTVGHRFGWSKIRWSTRVATHGERLG